MALHESTKDMLDMLPRWAEIQNEDSSGAKFLDVIGHQLGSFEELAETILMSAIITPGDRESDPNKVNILEVDYLYKFRPGGMITDSNEIFVKTVLDGIETIPVRCETIYDFYKEGQDKYYLNTADNTFYFKLPI